MFRKALRVKPLSIFSAFVSLSLSLPITVGSTTSVSAQSLEETVSFLLLGDKSGRLSNVMMPRGLVESARITNIEESTCTVDYEYRINMIVDKMDVRATVYFNAVSDIMYHETENGYIVLLYGNNGPVLNQDIDIAFPFVQGGLCQQDCDAFLPHIRNVSRFETALEHLYSNYCTFDSSLF